MSDKVGNSQDEETKFNETLKRMLDKKPTPHVQSESKNKTTEKPSPKDKS